MTRKEKKNRPQKLPSETTTQQKLNAFVEALARGARPRATRLDFWIHHEEERAEGSDQSSRNRTKKRVSATLPRSGSLLPLFAALGLATTAAEREQLLLASSSIEEEKTYDDDGLGAEEADLLEWLASAARSAAAAGSRKAALASAVGAASADAALRHGLASPVLLADCCGSSASRAALVRALKGVRALDEAMALFAEEEKEGEEELSEEESATEEEQQSGGGNRGESDESDGDESHDDDASTRSSKPFRGLRVKLYTPASSRRRRSRRRRKAARGSFAEGKEEAEGGATEEEGGGDDDENDDESESSAWVSPSDGCLCVLLSRSPSSSSSLLRALRSDSVDLPTVRALSAARAYWQRRAAELAGPAAAALGVERVSWAEEEDDEDEASSSSSRSSRSPAELEEPQEQPPPSAAQRFVAWAAAVLGEASRLSPSSVEEEEASDERRHEQNDDDDDDDEEETSFIPRSRRLSLSVVVHSDSPQSLSSLAFFVAGGEKERESGASNGGEGDGEEMDFSSSTEAAASDAAASQATAASAFHSDHFQVSAGTLHVSASTSPRQLLSFLLSESGAAAALSAEREALERAEAEAEMAGAARALGAAAVVRVSPTASLSEVVEAARRLAGAAPLLAAAGIDLDGERKFSPVFFF